MKKKKTSVLQDVLGTVSKLFVVVVIAIVIFFCFSGVRFVKSGNVALILRFGKLVGDTPEEQIHEPGLMFAFPYIIDEVITVPTGSIIEQKIETHYTPGKMSKDISKNGYVITGDSNIAVISASLKYTVTDPVSYALKVKDAEAIINASVSNAMVEVSAHMPVDDILTSGKESFTSEVVSLSQQKLDLAEVGITVSAIELTYVGMPKEVRAVYEGVNSATVQANTIIENANQYRDTVIPNAESGANKAISEANTAYSNSVADANAALAEFWGVLQEYKSSRNVVRTRIYNQKVSEIMAKIGKVKVVGEGNSPIFID